MIFSVAIKSVLPLYFWEKACYTYPVRKVEDSISTPGFSNGVETKGHTKIFGVFLKAGGVLNC